MKLLVDKVVCKDELKDELFAFVKRLVETELNVVTQWIPCSERLPKSSGVYVVSRLLNDGKRKLSLTSACYFDGTDTWYDDTRINHGRDYVTSQIVAWLPLPEPYRGDDQ